MRALDGVAPCRKVLSAFLCTVPSEGICLSCPAASACPARPRLLSCPAASACPARAASACLCPCRIRRDPRPALTCGHDGFRMGQLFPQPSGRDRRRSLTGPEEDSGDGPGERTRTGPGMGHKKRPVQTGLFLHSFSCFTCAPSCHGGTSSCGRRPHRRSQPRG